MRTLTSDSSDFKLVFTQFYQSMKTQPRGTIYEIVEIHRIVNPTLWDKYTSKRAELDRSSLANERNLFCGTDVHNYPKINALGFNTDYPGSPGK